MVPVLLSYILSFIYIGIYWNNHHHMICAVDRINGAVLWANLCRLLLKEEGPGSRLAIALYVVVSVIWFIPDRRIEKALSSRPSTQEEP